MTAKAVQLPDDIEMEVWREAGRFICDCRWPRRDHIALFGCDECRTCGRLVLGHAGQELLRRRAKGT